MKTAIEWEQEIIKITMKIHQEYPELSKYIKEIPSKVSAKDDDEIHRKDLKEYYNSLDEILNKYMKTHSIQEGKNKTDKSKVSGYPLYPPSEDIYKKGKNTSDVNPSDLSKTKTPNVEGGSLNEKDFKEDMSGDDLDVPGSELDDQQEDIGSEDEENNYYSLGGDAHNDLEEDKG